MATKTKIKTMPYDPAEFLETEEAMAGYLAACMEDGDPALITDALGVIARAKGMTQLSRETGIAREALYRALSKKGNPAFSTVSKVFKALGYRLEARPV
jgi:probable addiction module antidote protein